MAASTPITRTYQQSTCTLTVSGQTTQPDDPSAIAGNLNCQLDLNSTKGEQHIAGDLSLLQDLTSVLERYARSLLGGQPQGTFSGTVAIRPLAHVTHRMTVRQGNGIGQADLSVTQLYDLTEALAELRASVPHLADLKLAPPPSWYVKPQGIAALVVGGVGVAAAIAVLATSGGETLVRQPEDSASSSESEIALSEGAVPITPNARRGALPEGDVSASQTEDEPPEIENALPVSSAAVESPESPENISPSDRLESLRQEWDAAWSAPEDLDTAWAYTVVIEPDGKIASALPVDEAASTGKASTPFAEVPTTSPATLPAEAQVVTVTFASDGVSVTEAE